MTFTGAPGAPYAIPVPAACSVAGLTLYSQAASVDALGTIALTNALDLALGTL